MKHGKRPTVAQRKLITSKGLNSDNWLVVMDTIHQMVIVHRLSGKQRRIEK